MKEIIISPEELKEAVDKGIILGEGFFSKVFMYNGLVIKMDLELFNLLRVNDISLSQSIVRYRYRWRKSDFNEREQIEELIKRQPNVKLTKLPTGIVLLEGIQRDNELISPGIIIPYHEDHQKLELLPKDDYERVLIILKKLLLAVKELEENGISQEDFVQYNHNSHSYNVMFQGTTPQIIDMSGVFVKVGREFTSPSLMYQTFGNLILDYFIFRNLPSIFKEDGVQSYQDASSMIDDLEEKVKVKR